MRGPRQDQRRRPIRPLVDKNLNTLLANAAKFTRAGRVDLRCRRDGPWLVFEPASHETAA